METSKHPHDDSGQITIAPVVATANATAYLQPEFLRLPRTGERDTFTGLSRSSLNRLILSTRENEYKPVVKSVVLRRRGAARGTRLIVMDSLREYLYSNVEVQEGN